MVAPAEVHAALWFDRDEQDRFFARLGRTLTISVVLHVVVLLSVMASAASTRRAAVGVG